MNNEVVKALSEVNATAWKLGLRSDNGEFVEWLPVTSLTDSNFFEGVTRTGEWVAETSSGLIDLSGKKPLAPLLPILEHSPTAVSATLNAAAERLGLPASLEASFPYEAVIFCGLSASSFWAELAMSWLERARLDATATNRMVTQLNRLAHDKSRHSQQTRHRAQRVSSFIRSRYDS